MRAVGRLGAMRTRAESLMTLTLDWHSPNGVTVVGGMEVPAFTSQGETPGKLQATSGPDTATRWLQVAGTERPVLAAALHIPAAALPALREGWECVVTDTGDAAPALLGRRFRVMGVPAKSYVTPRRLDVVEVS